jgi:hypothetical protein
MRLMAFSRASNVDPNFGAEPPTHRNMLGSRFEFDEDMRLCTLLIPRFPQSEIVGGIWENGLE